MAANGKESTTRKITVEIPDSFGFVRQKTPFNVDGVSKLASHILGNLLVHGIVQKVGDAAAGTEPGKEATEAMSKAWQQLVDGQWKHVGTGVDPIVPVTRTLTRTLIAARPEFKKQLATYKAIASDDQPRRAEYLDKVFAALPEKTQAELAKRAQAKLDAKAKEQSDIAALGAGVELTI